MFINNQLNVDISLDSLEKYGSSIQANKHLIMSEDIYSRLLEFAIENYYSEDYYLALNSKKFINCFFVGINKPSDLIIFKKFSIKDNIETILKILLDEFFILPDIFYFYLYKDKQIMEVIPYGESFEKILNKYLYIIINYEDIKIGYDDIFFHDKNYSNYIKEYALSWLYEEERLNEDTTTYFSKYFTKKYNQLKNL